MDAVVSPVDPCVFLKLFSFRTRTGSQSVHGDWIQLDLQVIHQRLHRNTLSYFM